MGELTAEAREVIADLVSAGEAVLNNMTGGDPRPALHDLEVAIQDGKWLLENYSHAASSP